MKTKHLVIFDIDGTLVDSVKTDFQCFELALEEVFPFQASNIEWESFPHMTDSALLRDVVRQQMHRNPTANEIGNFQRFFFARIEQKVAEMQPVKGMQMMLAQFEHLENCEIAFATGAWKRSARIKLAGAKVDIDQYPHATSDDHFVRVEIIAKAMQRSYLGNVGNDFISVTYVGDGLWDMKSAKVLGIDFVGVDIHGSGVLSRAGAKKILNNFENILLVEELLF